MLRKGQKRRLDTDCVHSLTNALYDVTAAYKALQAANPLDGWCGVEKEKLVRACLKLMNGEPIRVRPRSGEI